MQGKKFKPLIDKMYWWILIPTVLLMASVTAVAFLTPVVLFVMIPADLLVTYFLVSTLAGYVELRENSVFIRFGFFMKREIPYSKIRGVSKERKFYADSILALKNSFEHVNIKYNTFDMISVSVVGNDELMEAIEGLRLI